MKNTLLLSIAIALFSFSLHGQNLSADLQQEIAALGGGESFEMKYVKKGCWGTYEGGGITFTLDGDSIAVVLINQQNYLESKPQTSRSTYQVDELIQTLEENKKSFSMDDSNIVLANSFEYRLEQNGKELVAGASALEPANVVSKVALSNSLMDSFLGNQKGILKNSGVTKGSGINN